MRIGFGYDIHRLKTGEDLILGGEKIDSEKGLEGHSDADVLIHALIDSLLGASSLGDIGVYFPDSDPQWRGISSLILLEKISALLAEKRWAILNVDLTLVLEKPKLFGYYPGMKKNIARVLKMSEDNINIKASTNEGIELIGKEEGIAAFSVALLEKR
ncbi:MAG: 2-C-methyl-D-erythritol 2,4-cyclodiphosphate synthase [Candidatus Atribacteria bacterium]|nr:2-C-methyl-D-erythritol 2,4-cyclodiphosphate synthase [Candidatus Atribacteria bacterium]